MFQATLTTTQTTPIPLSECLLEDWRSSWTAPPPGDQHHHFTPLREPPDLHTHEFVQGVLTAESHMYQFTAFQLITRHAFDTTCSSRFRAGADDNTTCPHCGNCYTINHILFNCDHFIEMDKGDMPIWKEYFQLWYMQGMPYALYDNYAYVTL